MSEPLFPWVTAPEVSLGFLRHLPLLDRWIDPHDPPSIKPFGTLVAIGVYLGTAQVIRRARERGYHPKTMSDFLFWTVASGFVISHVFDAFTYHPQTVLADPLYLLRIWEGLSSYGGFIGALVGSYAWCIRHHQPVMPYIDVTVSGMPLAWVFGRAGCAVVHDHPGILSNSWFAVRFPPAHLAKQIDWIYWGPDYLGRFDLGLLEHLLTIPLAIAVAVLWRRNPKRPDGFYTAVICTAYAPVRFALDFLRVGEETRILGADPRYFGLTPAQWASVALLALGLFHLRRVRQALREGRGCYLPPPEPDEDEAEEAEPGSAASHPARDGRNPAEEAGSGTAAESAASAKDDRSEPEGQSDNGDGQGAADERDGDDSGGSGEGDDEGAGAGESSGGSGEGDDEATGSEPESGGSAPAHAKEK